MTKSNVTRKSALSAAIIAFDFLNMEGIRPEGMSDVDYMEVKETLSKMLEQVSKPRAKAVSKARKMNENLAERIMECFPFDGGLQTTKDVVAMGFAEITTTQKAAAVMRVAEELGLASKVKEGKNIRYVIATADDSAEDE